MKPIPSFPLKESSGDGSPPSVVYVPVSVAPQSYDPYPKRMSIGLGTTQILLGVLCIVFNTISLAAWGAHYGFVDISLGYGILCGALVSQLHPIGCLFQIIPLKGIMTKVGTYCKTNQLISYI